MEIKFDLKEIFRIDPMHDERIDEIEVNGRNLIFHYSKLKYHEGYHSCRVQFDDGQDACVEVKEKDRPGFASAIYDMDEFSHYIKEKHYQVETIDYYCGYADFLVTAALINKDGYGEHCFFTIPASTLIYQWE